MEDTVLAELEGFSVTEGESIHGQHPRFSKYKNLGKIEESQRQRRSEHLDRQKNKRDEYANKFRAIYEEDEEEVESKKSAYADCLMLSEWLVDIPGTLSTDWIMMPCPEGRRCLVVASKGWTVAYTKKGTSFLSFASQLPGGHDAKTTILDCVLDREAKRFYVLDMICWGSMPFDETEFSCRLFFLQSKLAEDPSLAKATRRRPYSFHALPYCNCTVDDMKGLMQQKFEFTVDGLLFFHSQVHYSPGQTPLVGWLKPWMLTEILQVPVPAEYFPEGEDTSSSRNYIAEYNAKHNFKSGIPQKADTSGVAGEVPSEEKIEE